MFLIIFVVIISITIISGVYQKCTNAVVHSRKRLDGKTVIVTGGTTGIGFETAADFAARGARVIIACPFEDEAIHALKELKERTENHKVCFKFLDLGSLRTVRSFAEDILKNEDRLDILVNNAGVGVPRDQTTADGLSFIMQVNYFGHFLLAILLLPLLKRTGKPSEPSRIINVSSFMSFYGHIALSTLNRIQNSYLLYAQTYSKSKRCMALFTTELSKRLEGLNVVVNSVNPGFTSTPMHYSAGRVIGLILYSVSNLLFKNTMEGAQTTIHVAIDDEAGQMSGQFFTNCKPSRFFSLIHNEKLAKALWVESVKHVKLTTEELEIANDC